MFVHGDCTVDEMTLTVTSKVLIVKRIVVTLMHIGSKGGE